MDMTTYINALKSNVRQSIIKIEWLDNNENVVGVVTPTLINGTLDLDMDSGIRRRCSLTMSNLDGSYIPIPEGFLWVNSKFRLWTGLVIDGVEYLFSRGIFLIGEPAVNSFITEKTVSLTGYDKWAMLDGTLGGKLESDYIIPLGTNIGDAVRAIFQQAGEIKTPIISDITETTPYTITKTAGDTYADLLKDLANIVSWECFYDKDGYPRFQPPTDIEKDPSVWDFSSSEVVYLGSAHRYDFTKIKNYVVVIGDNINGSLVRAVAQDDNPTSPTRVSLIGKRVLVIEDNLIYNNDLAQQRANYELQKAIAMYESVDLNCIPIDIIDEGSVVTITDSSAGLNQDRFIVQAVSFPLSFDGEMRLTVWKTRSFS